MLWGVTYLYSISDDLTCTTNDDCTALAHSACTGDPKKCKCAAGYKHETEACVKKGMSTLAASIDSSSGSNQSNCLRNHKW